VGQFGPTGYSGLQFDALSDLLAQQIYGQDYYSLAGWQQIVVTAAADAFSLAQVAGYNPPTAQGIDLFQLAQQLASAMWSLQVDEKAEAFWAGLGATYIATGFQQSIISDKQNIAFFQKQILAKYPHFDTSYSNMQRLFPLILGPQQGASLTPANSSVYATLERPSPPSALGFSNEQAPHFPDNLALAYAMLVKAPQPPAAFQPQWTAWVSGGGGYSRASGNSDTFTSRASLDAGGLSFYFSPNTYIGLAVGQSDGPWSTASGASGRGDSLLVALYGRTQAGPAYLAGWLDAAKDWQNSTRAAAGDQVFATLQTQIYGGHIEAGYRFSLTPITGITPYGAVQVQTFHTPGYSEVDLAGGIQAATYNTESATDTQSELGARFDNSMSLGGMTLSIRARAAWAHNWVSGWSATGLFQSAPGVGFTVSGIAPPQDSVLATLETELRFNPNWSVSVKYDGQFGNSWQTQTGIAKLRYAW
jgi:Autotransporter beta-domain